MLKAKWERYRLQFVRESRTSREVLHFKDTWFIKVTDRSRPGIFGIGEAAMFRGLSADDTPEFEQLLYKCCKSINDIDINTIPSSAIRMGFETAISDINNGGIHQPFYVGMIPPTRINGLIWMGSKEFMLNEIQCKLALGFHCLKLKIGGIDFENEVDLLRYIRRHFSPEILEIRLDANGAFNEGNAMSRLETLSQFVIHSIEQPVRAGQRELMSSLCRNSPIPIALDEELIGIFNRKEKSELLDDIQPQYIILKPTLCGGFRQGDEWIELAEERGIGWWATSALESNIGLNAIARWTATHKVSMPQGLGTGQLYINNIISPLVLKGEYLTSRPDNSWNINPFF